jgi:hypothetical protein
MLTKDIVLDQNVETQAWEERVALRRTTLSKPWKLSAAILSTYHSHNKSGKKAPKGENINPRIASKAIGHNAKAASRKIDFETLPRYAHSIRNLKLFLLDQISTLQRFTPAELLSSDAIHHAAKCVATHESTKVVTERDIANTLLAALNLLLRDGNIIVPRQNGMRGDIALSAVEGTYLVVGTWNLGTTINATAKREGKVIVRELWKKIVEWGSGWEATTKGVIGVVVEDVLTNIEGQEWVESRAGVWTRLDGECK